MFSRVFQRIWRPKSQSTSLNSIKGFSFSSINPKSQIRVAVFWDLDNKPPASFPPYDAAVKLRTAASSFGFVKLMVAYANRHAFSYVPLEVREQRKDRKLLNQLENKGLVKPPEPYFCGPMASRLKSRSVVRFSGPDTVKFLQGLLTNDVRRFGESSGEKSSAVPTPNIASVSTPPMYAALLTPQGRFLYDFFLYSPSKPEEKLNRTGSGPGSDSGLDGSVELFADVDVDVLDELLETLKRYRLRSKVDIENVAEEFSCWQRYGRNLSGSSSVGWGGGVDRVGETTASGNKYGWQWYKDPRLECLGYRSIFPSDTTPPLVEADKETDESNYLLWRLEHGVAEGSAEIPKGEAIPLEYNFVGLNAISFDKGCYVGQELIARTHHRGVIRKRLIPLRFIYNNGKEVNQKIAAGAEVVESGTGKKIGTVSTALGSRGMGVMRVEEAFKPSAELTVKDTEDVKVEAIRPTWWPTEWFQ